MGTSGECINRRKKRETEPSTEHKENIRLLLLKLSNAVHIMSSIGRMT